MRRLWKRLGLLSLILTLLLTTWMGNVIFAAGEVKLSGTATASTYDTRCTCDATQAVDGNLSTRWSGQGNGAWLKLDLGSSKTVAFVKMGFYDGASRTFTFNIETSTDNSTWTTRASNVSSSLNNNLQTFDFSDVTARYVRIVGAGNTSNDWNSYTEVEAWGFDSGGSTDSKFAISGSSVTASTHDGNVPANTVDGNLTTRWSGQGDGAWIRYDLGSNKKVAYIKMAFHNGSSRTSTFDIQTSTNGTSWNTIRSGVTSAMNNNLQTFDFTDVDPARYVRLVGHGNTSNDWNSYTEVEIYGGSSSGGGGDTTAPTAPTGLAASAVSSSQINLSWNASSDNVGVTGYDVYRGGSFLKSVTGTSTSDTGLSPSTTYSYTVRAKDAAGNQSSNSNTASATTQAGSGGGTVVNVSTTAQLETAIANATAGTTIVLANGTYTKSGNISIKNKNGTASNPITIKAANRGGAIISGSAYFIVTTSSYIVIEGLKFTNTGNHAIKLDQSNNIRITRNRFQLTENGNSLKWVYVGGANSHHNRIDRNEFGPKRDLGNFITFDGSATQVSQYDIVEYNYFHDIGPRATNEMEAIRLGWSQISMSNAYTTIQYNLFENADGDPEIISVKSGQNIVRYNTFRNSEGVLSSRHGHANSFYGNFFLGNGTKPGVGGIRIYGNDHKIYNNYFEGLTGSGHSNTITIDGGDFDGGSSGTNYSSSDLSKHWRVYRALVVNNTIVNSKTGIVIGDNYSQAPVGSVVANNIVKNSTGTLYDEQMTSNTVFRGNIGHGSTITNKGRTSSEIRNIDPAFTTVNGLQKLTSSSPAVNSAVSGDSFVTDDMDGQSRSTMDVGADEYSTSSVLRKPLTTIDVGINAP
jgi:poly(beta-D-mannuronate) lyase